MLAIVQNPFDGLFSRLQRYGRQFLPNSLPGWQLDLRIALIAFGFSTFFAFPSLWQWLAGDPNRINEFLSQAENPWRRDLTEPILEYRFLVPLLNHWLGLRGLQAVLPGVVASFFNLFLLSRIIRARTRDISYTLFLCVGFSFSFFIAEGTTFLCSPDSVSHFFVLCLVAFDLPFAAACLLTLCAMLVDERAIFSLAFSWIFKFRDSELSLQASSKTSSNSWLGLGLSIFVGLLLWKGIRVGLDFGWWAAPIQSSLLQDQSSQVFASATPLVGWPAWFINTIAAFKWIYFFPGVYTYRLFQGLVRRDSGFPHLPTSGVVFSWCLNLLLFSIVIAASAFNGDVWRTVSFAYLFLIEACVSLHALRPTQARRMASASAVLMIATPVAYVASDLSERIAYPMPFVIWRTFLGGKGALSWLLSLVGIHRGGL